MRALHMGATALICASLFGAGAAVAGDDEPDADAAAKKAGAFYQKFATASCSGGTCTATFPKVPGGKVLETTILSCTANASGFSAIPAFATLQAGSTILAYMPLQPFSNGSNDTLATGALGGATFIDKGKVPSVVIKGGATAASCTLSGRLD